MAAKGIWARYSGNIEKFITVCARNNSKASRAANRAKPFNQNDRQVLIGKIHDLLDIGMVIYRYWVDLKSFLRYLIDLKRKLPQLHISL